MKLAVTKGASRNNTQESLKMPLSSLTDEMLGEALAAGVTDVRKPDFTGL